MEGTGNSNGGNRFDAGGNSTGLGENSTGIGGNSTSLSGNSTAISGSGTGIGGNSTGIGGSRRNDSATPQGNGKGGHTSNYTFELREDINKYVQLISYKRFLECTLIQLRLSIYP